MKKYSFCHITFTALAGFCLSQKSLANILKSEVEKKSPKKNVLMIAVDDLKPLLGCYGDPIANTPNIDKLANQGTLFTSAYCQQAVSAATRSSLLTGWTPDRTRVWDLKTLIRSQNPDVITLPQYFVNNGYIVAGIGKIYDSRSVDKDNDIRSWSQPYIKYENFINKEYQEPVMAFYQSNETRSLYNKYQNEAKEKGIQKQREVVEYIQKYIKPSTECIDIPDNAYVDGAITDGAVKFINEYSSEKPFFLAVGFKKPHLPFCAPKKYWDLYNREQIPLASFRKRAKNSPDFAYHNCGELQSYTDIPSLISFSDIENVKIPDDKARELIHGYYACVSYIDAQIGAVIETLEKKGLKENTIIVLWGDHGWHLGDHGLWNKHTNFEHATHVPMVIIDPSSKSRKIIDPVEFLSIYPTICDLAGIKIPEGLDGENLSQIIRNEKDRVNKQYAVSQYPRVKKMGYSLRSNRYRYTVWVEWNNRKLNVDKVIAEELYDYDKDPNETINVVSDKKYTAALKLMKQYWEDYKKDRIPM